MSKRRNNFSEATSFLLPIVVGMTFPLQVITNSSAFGAAPILIIGLLLARFYLFGDSAATSLSTSKESSSLRIAMTALLLLALTNIFVTGIVFDSLQSNNILPPLYMIVSSGSIYFYYSRLASKREVDWFIGGMVLMGSISGIFFAYESINKQIFQEITEYTRMAHEYSLNSIGLDSTDQDASLFRIDLAYRSFGLLERHSTSALWVILACFSYLRFQDNNNKSYIAIGLSMLTLLIAQNFTAIVVFIVVTYIFYRRIVRLAPMLVTLCIIPIIIIISIDIEKLTQFVNYVAELMESQFALLLATDSRPDSSSYLGLILSEYERYLEELYSRPYQLILGYGIGSNPFYITSGDVGFIESVMRLGLPLWLYFTIQVVLLSKNVVNVSRKYLSSSSNHDNLKLITSMTTIILAIWMMDVHYTAWINKSIFPIIIFSIAILRRSDVNIAIVKKRKRQFVGFPFSAIR